MKNYQIAEAKTNFSAVMKEVEMGEEVTITRGKNREPIGVIVPLDTWKKTKKRKLGTLEHWGVTLEVGKDWYMTSEEFLGVDDEILA
jgi:prevent-host-death family protein